MTTLTEAEEMAQLERFLNGVAPAGSGNPIPPPGTRLPRYMNAEQHLAVALEGTAPALARHVAEKLAQPKVLELADAIRRAVDRAVRKQVAVEVATRLAALAEVVEAGLEGLRTEDECVSPEPTCDHADSLYGRCTACGMTWEQQAEMRRG